MDWVELDDLAAARREAVEMATDLLRDSLSGPEEWPGWRIEVEDEQGRLVLSRSLLET